jgi:hypothetical protein
MIKRRKEEKFQCPPNTPQKKNRKSKGLLQLCRGGVGGKMAGLELGGVIPSLVAHTQSVTSLKAELSCPSYFVLRLTHREIASRSRNFVRVAHARAHVKCRLGHVMSPTASVSLFSRARCQLCKLTRSIISSSSSSSCFRIKLQTN